MDPFFPATYSTLSPSSLASLVSQKYGLGNVQCRLLVRGVGDTYLVESSTNRYILRIYRSIHRTEIQIKAETDLLLALKAAGVQVSFPVLDLSGGAMQSIGAIEGKRFAVLFTFAPGQVLHTLNEKQLYNLGRQMARFHDVSAAVEFTGQRWKYDLQTTLEYPLQQLKVPFEGNEEGYEWLKQAANRMQKKLREIDTSAFSRGFCHFDFLPKNFHFDGDSVTLFDFDFMGYGWLVNDVMTFWQHLCLDVHFGRMTQDD